MLTLDTEFSDTHFNYKQIHREGLFAIYKKIGKLNCHEGFEVIKIQHRNDQEIYGKKYLASEMYPTNSEWGKYGFSYRTKQESYAGFDKLVKYFSDIKEKAEIRNKD